MRVLTTMLLLLLLAIVPAQAQLKNSAYDLMLGALYSNTVQTIDSDEAKSKKNVIYLDTREKAEYKVSHIEGAIWVGYDDFDIARVADLDKNTTVVVYCTVGYRSEKIGEKLLAAGFTNVSNLYGGIFSWKNAGYEVMDESGAATEKMHAYSPEWGIWLDEGEKVY